MSALFAPPRYSPMSGNGTSYPGAKLYFFETGTTTPKDTFSDPDLDPSHVQAHPVVADANGLFAAIYLEAGDYSVVLKDTSDNTLWSVDPYTGLGAADTLTTRGDLLTRDATGYKRLAVGTSGQYLSSNGTDPLWATPPIPRGSIQGLTYANNATDATNDIDIAVGSAMDSTNARMMVLEAALTKKSDAVWAVGSNQGALDTGSVSDTDYFIWLINRSDTNVTDILFSTSDTSPTMPADYNYRRLIGWFRRASSAIVAFKVYETDGGGIDFYWVVPTLDVSLADTLTTSGRTDSIRVPQTFSTVAKINALISDASSACLVWIYNPDQTSAAPSDSAAPLANMALVSGAGIFDQRELRIRTSADGKIGARANLATVDVYKVSTMGFEWSRR